MPSDRPLPQLSDLDDDALAAAYAPPRAPWVRLNFVSTVDGAVTGTDGLSKSIQNDDDQRVFEALRALCDVIVVGAGTIRAEGYRPNAQHLVVVSRSGAVPASLRQGSLEKVWMATGSSTPHLDETRDLLGERLLVLGEDGPDLTRLTAELTGRGFSDVLCEGGPTLARDLLAAGLVDELCLTVVPRLVAGEHLRVLDGAGLDLDLELAGILEQGSTLLQRWFVRRS